jgi:hypothetical protein
MKKRAKKLTLAKETVRSLSGAELGVAAGGEPTDTCGCYTGTCGTGYCGESYACSGACWSDPLYVCPPRLEPMETTDC